MAVDLRLRGLSPVTQRMYLGCVERFVAHHRRSPCGDGVIDPGEACDGGALGACTVGCQPDCTCTCETACCYVENLAVPPDTECFEYTGTPAQIAAFGANCSGSGIGVPGSLPAGFMVNSTLFGPCVAGPLFGMGCLAGPPGMGNLHVMPQDSSCP